MAYKGDSPGKAVTRLRMWSVILRLVQRCGVPLYGAMALAGEGGDISYLKEYLPIDHIHAVDFDGKALKKVYDKYGCQVHYGEVGEVAKNIPFNICHLDFCGRLSVDTILSVYKTSKGMVGPGFMGITLLKGREKEKSGLKKDLWVGVSRQQRKSVLRKWRKQSRTREEFNMAQHLLTLKDGEHFNPKYMIKMATEHTMKFFTPCSEPYKVTGKLQERNPWGYEKKGKLGPLALGGIRMFVIRTTLDVMYELQNHDIPISFGSCWNYHSKTKKDHGTPFVTSIFSVGVEVPKRIAFEEFRFDSFDAKRSMNQLKNIVCSAPREIPAEHLADLFKISARTISAWRAHYTMGKYSFDEPPAVSFFVGGVDGYKASTRTQKQTLNHFEEKKKEFFGGEWVPRKERAKKRPRITRL